MSFTAEVKDELSRIEAKDNKINGAELSALMSLCGTIVLQGRGAYSVRMTTETGAVARMLMRLPQQIFNLRPQLITRRSNLHKTHNYLLEIVSEPALGKALQEMGILDASEQIIDGVAPQYMQISAYRKAYLRGAFMATGFIANPRTTFHVEFNIANEAKARDICYILLQEGIDAKMNARRAGYVIYIKNYTTIVKLLLAMGAVRTAKALSNAHKMKEIKNKVNRQVNAEMANANRASEAAASQLEMIDFLYKKGLVDSMSDVLAQFCEMRKSYPEETLTQLGKRMNPPATKSALYHRLVRLEKLARANGMAH